MATPPRDSNGNVIPHDDSDIQPHNGLIRNVNPDYHVVWDDNKQVHRLSTAAFSDSRINGGVSVDLEELMHQAGLANTARIPLHPGWGAVRLETGHVRGLGLKVGRNPITSTDPSENNPYHGEIWGVRKRKSIQKQLVQLAVWIKKAAGIP